MSVCFAEDGHFYAVRLEDGHEVPDKSKRLRWDPAYNGYVPADPGTRPHNETYEGKLFPVPAQPILGG